ncbi:hypothetical protein Tco_0672965, partial [Tanacetum coccineum]
RVDRELKEDMVISILNVKDDGEVLYTVRVKYEWELPRINELKSQMVKGKLVLLGDDGKPLMRIMITKLKSMYEQWKKSHGEDPYNDDDFNAPGLLMLKLSFLMLLLLIFVVNLDSICSKSNEGSECRF